MRASHGQHQCPGNDAGQAIDADAHHHGDQGQHAQLFDKGFAGHAAVGKMVVEATPRIGKLAVSEVAIRDRF